jgi:hypothetical protein
MSAVPEWEQIEQRLLDQVFHRHDPARVRASHDLPGDGMIDSLSVIAALEVLVESTDDEGFLSQSQPADFTSLERIEALVSRVVGAGR